MLPALHDPAELLATIRARQHDARRGRRARDRRAEHRLGVSLLERLRLRLRPRRQRRAHRIAFLTERRERAPHRLGARHRQIDGDAAFLGRAAKQPAARERTEERQGEDGAWMPDHGAEGRRKFALMPYERRGDRRV